MIKFNTIVTVACFMLLLLACSFFAGRCSRRDRCDDNAVVVDTVTVVRTDTVFIESVQSTVIQKEIKVVRVPLHEQVHDTVVDSVLVSLPFELHYARLDSVADIWFSGYQTKIDSAVVYKRTVTQIIKQPYEVVIVKMPRATLDIGAAAFYNGERINTCLVGEIRWNAPKTTFSAFGAIDPQGNWAAGVGVTYRLNLIK